MVQGTFFSDVIDRETVAVPRYAFKHGHPGVVFIRLGFCLVERIRGV